MILKSAKEILWTKHAQAKMRFYGLSKQRVRRVFNSPKRTEEGIAPNTAAMMQPASIKIKDGEQTWSQEIWVMVQKKIEADRRGFNKDRSGKTRNIKIISAWRYPGKTKLGEPLPADILLEIKESLS